MLAQFVSDALRRRGMHYAWVVAAVTFLAMLVTSAAIGLPGAMLQPLAREFGWSTDEVAFVLAVRYALFGFLGTLSAVLIGRFGLRTIMAAALALIAVATGLVTQATGLWQLLLFWGVLLGIGTGLTALVLGAIVATRWFTARRGLVVGLLAASSATGQLSFLPLAAWLINEAGWRIAVLPVVVGCALVCLLVLLLIRGDPADVGLRPYGDPTADAPNPAAAPAPTFGAPFRALAQVARHRSFVILAGTFFICGLTTNGLVQAHFISICSDRGLSALPAASVLSMMGAFDIVGTTLSGYLSDRFDNRKLLFGYYGLRGVALLGLPHASFTLYGLSMFAMVYGLDWIATLPPTVRLTANEFGKERAALVIGWVFAAHQLGAATAAYGAGLTRALTLSYDPAVVIAGGTCLAAAVAILSIRRRAAP
jgi:predicted MFS family arabinose efflux permease